MNQRPFESNIFSVEKDSLKPQNLLLFRKIVRGMKGSKRKIVDGQIFEKVANLWPWEVYSHFQEIPGIVSAHFALIHTFKYSCKVAENILIWR